ncbi:hypothetical protein ACUW84_001586 [Bacillus sp. 153480031-1]
MDNRAIEIFEIEIKRQCDIFLMSVEYLNECINTEERYESGKIWYHIQSFLTSSANISKLLWGVKSEISDSRKELRRKLGVSEDSKLKHRKMRNFFEHFDEHIEEWVRNGRSSIFIDSNIGPKTAIGIVDSGEYQFMRNFDHETGIITFKQHEYDMKEIIEEIYKIYTLNFVK